MCRGVFPVVLLIGDGSLVAPAPFLEKIVLPLTQRKGVLSPARCRLNSTDPPGVGLFPDSGFSLPLI